jgi:RimJ/RimL family protein N-acetyltransferase
MRRKKLGKPILSAACKYGFDTLKFSRIYAEVKPENIASVKVFEDVGFVFQGMREGLRTYNLVR